MSCGRSAGHVSIGSRPFPPSGSNVERTCGYSPVLSISSARGATCSWVPSSRPECRRRRPHLLERDSPDIVPQLDQVGREHEVCRRALEVRRIFRSSRRRHPERRRRCEAPGAWEAKGRRRRTGQHRRCPRCDASSRSKSEGVSGGGRHCGCGAVGTSPSDRVPRLPSAQLIDCKNVVAGPLVTKKLFPRKYIACSGPSSFFCQVIGGKTVRTTRPIATNYDYGLNFCLFYQLALVGC